jgi:N-acyl-D-amino-acid deacylase
VTGIAQGCAQTIENEPYYDYIFRAATVIDGTGSAAKVQDVAVLADRIAAVGALWHAQAKQDIDARGLILAPGFIDVHTHDDLVVIRQPQMQAKLSQGVTTVITGNCGISAAPTLLQAPPPDPMNLLGTQAEFCYARFADYGRAVADAAPGVNVAALVGHTTLRNAVMSDLSQAASAAEIQQMQQLLDAALQQGAFGLSSGLAYHNAFAAPTTEIVAIGRNLATYGGIYTSHLRNEFADIIPALAEAADIGMALQVPVVISHLKCAGVANWGRATEVLDFLRQRGADQKLCCDCYPYAASSSTLDLKQVTADFDIFITWSEPCPQMAGQTLAAIAAQWHTSLEDAAARLMPAGAVYHGMAEADVQQILQFPPTMVGSDGLPCDPHPHPRLWGSFPRVIGHYSRDQQLFSLPQAIHKMTGLSAANFQLPQRGVIAVGNFADLVLFDSEKIQDQADFLHPTRPAAGIHQVFVNGQLAYQPGVAQTTRSGRFLTRQTGLENEQPSKQPSKQQQE